MKFLKEQKDSFLLLCIINWLFFALVIFSQSGIAYLFLYAFAHAFILGVGLALLLPVFVMLLVAFYLLIFLSVSLRTLWQAFPLAKETRYVLPSSIVLVTIFQLVGYLDIYKNLGTHPVFLLGQACSIGAFLSYRYVKYSQSGKKNSKVLWGLLFLNIVLFFIFLFAFLPHIFS